MLRRPKSKADYASLAKELRSYGFDLSYGKKGKRSGAAKAAVTKALKKVSLYTDNAKQKFVFKKYTPEEIKKLREYLPSKTIMPGGVFLRKPKGARVSPSLKLKKGFVDYKATGPKGGRVRYRIFPIDPLLLAQDEKEAVRALMQGQKKPRESSLIVNLKVNGFDSKRSEKLTLEEMAAYLIFDLLPRLRDPNLRGDNKHGSRALSDEEITDIFHLELAYYDKPAKRKTKRRR